MVSFLIFYLFPQQLSCGSYYHHGAERGSQRRSNCRKKSGEEEDNKWVWDRDQEPGPHNADPASALRPPTSGMRLLFHMRAEFILKCFI